MTHSLDPRPGAVPQDIHDETAEDRAATGPDAMTFFADEPGARVTTGSEGLEGDATGGEPGPNAGYTGGLATNTQGAVGMRQMVSDEATEARRRGDEPDANLAQQDQ